MSMDLDKELLISESEFLTVMRTIKRFSSDYNKIKFVDRYFFKDKYLTPEMTDKILEQFNFESSRSDIMLSLKGKIIGSKKKATVSKNKQNSSDKYYFGIITGFSGMIIGFLIGLSFTYLT